MDTIHLIPQCEMTIKTKLKETKKYQGLNETQIKPYKDKNENISQVKGQNKKEIFFLDYQKRKF